MWKRIATVTLLSMSMSMVGCVSKSYHTKKVNALKDRNATLATSLEEKKMKLRQMRIRYEAELAALKQKNSQQGKRLRDALAYINKLENHLKVTQNLFGTLRREFRADLDSGDLTLKVRNGSLVLVLPEKVLFPYNSAKLKTESKGAVRRVARVLSRYSYRWQVAGHADSTGSAKGNMQLSYRRAARVKKLMTRQGMPPKNIAVVAYGESQPIRSNDTRKGRAQNRRVELILQPRFMVSKDKDNIELSRIDAMLFDRASS